MGIHLLEINKYRHEATPEMSSLVRPITLMLFTTKVDHEGGFRSVEFGDIQYQVSILDSWLYQNFPDHEVLGEGVRLNVWEHPCEQVHFWAMFGDWSVYLWVISDSDYFWCCHLKKIFQWTFLSLDSPPCLILFLEIIICINYYYFNASLIRWHPSSKTFNGSPLPILGFHFHNILRLT